MKRFITALFSILVLIGSSHAFVPQARTSFGAQATGFSTSPAPLVNPNFPPALQRQRKSMAPVQTMSLFGLGAPELAIILIAAAFLLGPSKLAELGKDAGKIAGELKEVPKEFQKGMAEGEIEAQQAMAPTDDATKKDESK